jgi:hypothetical protein
MERIMKRIYIGTLFILVTAFLFALPSSTQAQDKKVRKSLRASVTQTLGVDTEITFDFGRPGVKGRNIWGGLEPYGMHPGNDYSKNKPYPWRAGADENTTITVSKDVKIEGKNLAAGKYGVHMIPSETDWIVIFSKKNSDWGSYSYDEKEDALRVTVKPVQAAHQEWLTFGFDDLAGTSATAFLHWEKLKVPLKIEVTD